MARPEGLEPPAYWFEANRSIQLSYGRGLEGRNPMLSEGRNRELEFRRQNAAMPPMGPGTGLNNL